MCGICGIFVWGERQQDLDLVAQGQLMCNALVHRGPDDAGLESFDLSYGAGILGHRRLSIIDLSPRGRQPMRDLSGELTITYNGEIYNYVELRAELEKHGSRFFSNTDTEVLLNGYAKWGEDVLDRVEGMFSFTIVDRRRGVLFCARDRLGIKPFYYSLAKNKFFFASEVKALIGLDEIPFGVNTQAVAEYVTHTMAKSTWFTGIEELDPGTKLIMNANGLQAHRYWNIRFGDVTAGLDRTETVASLRSMMFGVVQKHLRADVPIGMHLSGGIDSSLILGLARQLGHRPATFTIEFQEEAFDEGKHVRGLLLDESSPAHFRTVDYSKLPDILPTILYYLDYPEIGPAIYPQFLLYELIREKGYKVILGGQGGDEIFAGYPWHILPYIMDLTRRMEWKRNDFLGLFTSLVPRFGVRGLFAGWHRRTFGFQAHDALNPDLISGLLQNTPDTSRHVADSTSKLAEMLFRDQMYFLKGLLHLEDRLSMAFSVESRVPLCDHNLVEAVNKCPNSLKLGGMISKRLEREICRPFVPPQIVDRKDKKGFDTPIDIWFRTKLFGWVSDVLTSSAFRQRGIFETKVVEKLLAEHRKGMNLGNRLWLLLCVELWFQKVPARMRVCGPRSSGSEIYTAVHKE